jgi:uncharacterized membrane protein
MSESAAAKQSDRQGSESMSSIAGETLTADSTTKSAAQHPAFQAHVNIIQWLDKKLSLAQYANEVVIDFTGEVQYPSAMIAPLMYCLVPFVIAAPIFLFLFAIYGIRKYGWHRDFVPLIFAGIVSALSYAALFALIAQRMIQQEVKVKMQISFVELLACPTLVLMTCLAFLIEIFLLRVEDAAAVQARGQLLAGPQAVYSAGQEHTADNFSGDLHGLIALLRHMSKSLREQSGRSLMMSIFQFSVIEQILRSDTHNLHHAHISDIMANMRNAPAGPSPSSSLAVRGNEPLTLAWECFVKYKKGITSHIQEFIMIVGVSAFVAIAPCLLRWRHGMPPIPRNSGFAVPTLVVTYIFITFVGLCVLLILTADGKHRFSHLKRSLVVIMYISGTPRFRPALHARFYTILKDIILAHEGDSAGASMLKIDSTDPEDESDRIVVQNFADRFCKHRELCNIGDEKISVSFPTLAVNKFFLLRMTIRTLVATERLRQQMYMCAIFICIIISGLIAAFPLFAEHRNPGDHAIVGFVLFIASSFPLAIMLNEAVTMNNIMQSQSLSSLKAWSMEIQEVHWTCQSHYRQFPVSEARLLLDNYFRGLLEPYRFMTNHIQESEQPMSFFGMDVTSQRRNQILGSMASSGLLYLTKLLSTPVGDRVNQNQF